METEDNTDKIEVGLDMNRIMEEETSEETWGAMTDRIVEESIETIIEITVMIEAGTVPVKGHFPEVIITIEIGVQAIVGPGQAQEQVWIDRIRCYKCREWEYPTSREVKEIEQLQQMFNFGDEQTSSKSMITNIQDNFSGGKLWGEFKTRTFKLITGRNDPTAFLPLSPKIGGQVNNNKPNVGQYLTREQANHVYRKTELGEVINTETLWQELEHRRQLNGIDDTSRETNPYRELIVNNTEKIEPLLAQMEQWSILSNTLNYIQYDRHPKNYHSLGISVVNKCGKNLGIKEERDLIEWDFGPMPDILMEEYLDTYKGIHSEILNTTRFDKNSDLSTTYLGKSDRSKNDKIKAEESFPISEQGYTLGKLLDRT